MTDSQPRESRLVWKDEYSVNVKEIDDQHKKLFAIITNLVHVVNSVPQEETVRVLVNDVIAYKTIHLATEEKYFHQFNYADSIAHEAEHRKFGEKIAQLQADFEKDPMGHAFALVDFLEDWFLGHTLHTDHKYKKCFNEHGLY